MMAGNADLSGDDEFAGLENVEMNNVELRSPGKKAITENSDLMSVDDRIEEAVTMPSPHFRPAPETTVNLSQTLGGLKQQGRKSLGRRVSFAATAHVRLYDKEEEERQQAALKQQQEEQEAAAAAVGLMESPKSPAGGEKRLSLVHSPVPVFNPSRAAPASPSRLRFHHERASSPASNDESVGSFDVDLKDNNSSSFTSYISGCEDNDEDGGHGNSHANQLASVSQPEDIDMEFTGCVGGILDKVDTRVDDPMDIDSTLVDFDGIATPMDMTVCVGGIMKRLDLGYTASPSSVDTMELTECVGQILARQRQQQLGADNVAGGGGGGGEEEEDMDMTTVLPTNIQQKSTASSKQPSHLSSPSPFLVASPRMTTYDTPSKSQMTFIGDIGVPAAMDALMSPSGAGNPVMTAEEKSKDQKLFQTFIDTDRLGQDEPVTNVFTASAETAGMRTPMLLLLKKKSSGSAFASSMSTIASPSLGRSKQSLSMATLGMEVTPIKGGGGGDNAAVASLADFLADTGIRFLENIASLKRRETTGRPRDSDIVAPSKQAHLAAALLPQVDFYEEASNDLVASIMDIKEALARQEGQFGAAPPMAYLQYQRDAAGRPHLLSRLKTLKSVSRMLSKHSWHQWRLSRQTGLVERLAANLDALQSCWTPLSESNDQLDALIGQVLEPRFRELHAELAALEHLQAFPDEVEQARQMEQTVAAQESAIGDLDAELAALEAQEARLREALSITSSQKAALQSSIEESRAALEAAPEVTELVLDDLRSQVALGKAVSAWEFLQIRPDSVVIKYMPAGPVTLQFDLDARAQHVVTGMRVLEAHKARSPLLRQASRLFDPNAFAGLTLSQALLQSALQLDRLFLFTHQLESLSLHCSYEVPEPAFATAGIPLCLTFFSYEARSKFDLSLTIGSNSLNASGESSFVHHYGPVGFGDVKDCIGLALSSHDAKSPLSQPLALKSLIMAVHHVLADKAAEGRPSDAFSLPPPTPTRVTADPTSPSTMSSKKGASAVASGPSLLKLIIPSGKATAGPPIGPALGQKGVKAIDFCKQFNDATKPFMPETPLRCFVTVQPNRTFSFSIRPPGTTWFLKRLTGVEKASSEPGKVVAKVSAKYLYEIAKVKQAEDPDMVRLPLRSVYSMLLASATKCGFSIF